MPMMTKRCQWEEIVRVEIYALLNLAIIITMIVTNIIIVR